MTLPLSTQRRQAVATGLRAKLPTGWHVYTSPPNVSVANSVVIAPRSPYRELLAYKGTERLNLMLHVLYPLAQGVDVLDADDEIVDKVLEGLDAATVSIGWSAVEVAGVVEVNGAECLATTVAIEVV